MNDNEPLFDETGELTAQEKAKEQVDLVRAQHKHYDKEKSNDRQRIFWAGCLSSIGNLIMLYDNEEIDETDLIDSIREITEIR